MPWGSRIFLDADGTPIKRADGRALQQYYVDRDGHPVLTRDGRPLIVPVEVPEGSSVEGPAHGA
jgi:hypothetical protein